MESSKANAQPIGLDFNSILSQIFFFIILIPVVLSDKGKFVVNLKILFAVLDKIDPTKEPPILFPPRAYLVPLTKS